MRFFRAFSSVVRQMPGYNWQRRGTASTLPKLIVMFCVLIVLCRSAYCVCVCVCVCVNVYCTAATGWLPNCSLTHVTYIKFPMQCPLVLLIKLRSRGGKLLESAQSKMEFRNERHR